MDKKFLPLGLAVFAPPPPPPHSCLWSSDYRGESSIGTLLVCTVAKIHIEAACFETSETYQHRHLMPYCTSILTRASTTTREDSFYLCCPSTWQNKLLYQYLFLLLNSGYSPPPSIHCLLMLVLGYPYKPACKVSAFTARGWAQESCLAGRAGTSWVATFQSHFMICHQKARHTHWNAARALPQCLL